MKNLLEVSKIVTKKKVRKIEIFDDHSLQARDSKFNEFYEALMAGKLKNDRDAAKLLYDCSPTDDKYRQLKSRFKKRLLNTLFFLDINLPATSTYDRAYYSCNKDWTLVKILLSNNAENTAASLARQIFTTALKYKFADVIVNCARILRKHAADMGDEKRFEEYDQHIKQYANVLDAEIRSEELYQRVIMNYYKPPSKKEGLEERIDTYCQALDGLARVYKSPIVNYNKLLMWIFRYEMLGEYQSMLQVCEKAERYISDNPHYAQEDKLMTFHKKKVSAYLHLKDREQGLPVAAASEEVFAKGSDEWYDFLDYYILLALHTGQYDLAQMIYNRAVSEPKFRKLDDELKEKWRVLEVYVYFLVEHESPESADLSNKYKSAFRVSRFLNETIEYPKDQRIFTVLLLVAQVLFLLEKRSYTQATERILQLKTFANRQLKREEYYRAVQFIRLMQQLPKSDFQQENFGNVGKYLKKLGQQPFFYKGLITELEPLPYEQLWQLMLNRLRS